MKFCKQFIIVKKSEGDFNILLSLLFILYILILCVPVKDVLENKFVMYKNFLRMTNENFSTSFHKSESKFIFQYESKKFI